MATAQTKTANDLAGERTDLAVERTVMAADRSLMAWVRTALSMISFGFTIYKFLDAATQGDAVGLIRANGPRRLGLFLIALGTVSVVLGAIEYFKMIRRLNAHASVQHRSVTFTFVVGVIIGLLGLFLFVTIATNTEVF